MRGLETQRREELLALAEGLSMRLRSAQVPYLAKAAPAAMGVAPSTLAHATSYLARVRDRERFAELVARFDQLDRITAQNPDNPKAEHRVVREELEAFLAENAVLSGEELLYVLSWARRLLPRVPDENGHTSRPARREKTPETGWRQRQAPQPPPPGETLWKSVKLELWQGTPTIFKGNQNASCGKTDLSSALLKKLKQRKSLQVDARVVKRGPGEWRIEEVTEAE
jgi:hypothetical protein